MTFGALLLEGILLAAAPAGAAQEPPPRPIDELVAEFLEDPGSRVRTLPGACPAPESWQRELLIRLLDIPTNSRAASPLISSHSYNVRHCHIPELDLWFREALVDPPREWSVRPVTWALWYSGREENREAVVAALFDPDLELRLREAMGDQLTGPPPSGIGQEEYLHVLAEGYALFGTEVPPTPTMRALRQAGYDGSALDAKRALLDAWLSRPADPGALTLLSLLVNDTLADAELKGWTSTPWLETVDVILQRIVSGEVEASDEVVQYASLQTARLRMPPGGH